MKRVRSSARRNTSTRAGKKLRTAGFDLEAKVKARTAELEQAKERLEAENRERVRTEQLLRLKESRLDALLHLSRISEAPLSQISTFALEQAIALTHSEIGFLGFLNEDESVYTLHAVSKDVVKECNVTDGPLQWHVAEAGLWAEAIRERKTLVVNDYAEANPKKKGLPPGHPFVKRFMVVPVSDRERIVAVAGVGNKAAEYDKFDERQIFLLLSGMWGFVQKDRARRDLQRAHNELEGRAAQLARLASELTLAEQGERRRIAEILHDDLQQLMVGARMSQEVLIRRLDGALKPAAERVLDLIEQAIKASRSLTTELSPAVLRSGDLSASLNWLARWMHENQGFDVKVHAEPGIVLEQKDLTVLIFRSIRELLFNVIKHAEVRSARVEVCKDNKDRLRVVVSDQGCGFDTAAIWEMEQAGTGFGLLSIRERMQLLGGTLELESSPGKGATLSLVIPLEIATNVEERA